MFKQACLLLLAWGWCVHAAAQQSTPQTHAANAGYGSDDAPASKAAVSIDPYQAYAEGRYADAFDGFANLQVKRPKDVDLMLNVGASLYRLKDFAGAEKAWALAAEHGDPNTRAEALYDMGNSAFQQEHLQEAVQHFESALSLKPEDEDAQYNLRLAKKRLEAQQQDSQKNQDPNAPKPPQDPNQPADKNQSDDPNNHQPADPNAQPQPKPQDGNQPQSGDPNSADKPPESHDKQEPKDAASKPAPGEKPGDDKAQGEAPSGKDEAQPAPDAQDGAQNAKRMPRSQAERMLDAMGESRPRHAPPTGKAGQRPADGMDW